MHATAATFFALSSFGRPATRRELERETGLNRTQIDGALRVLKAHGAIVVAIDRPKTRALYSLKPEAVCPPGRGKWNRSRRSQSGPHGEAGAVTGEKS